jgi:uncharacterized membrane protein YvbJ
MVYCTRCGTKNEEDATICAKCGASLATAPAWRSARRRQEKEEQECFGSRRAKEEQECFGLPHGGAIAGLVFGTIIIIAGLLFALQEWNVIEEIDSSLIWPFVIIIFGILVVAGAIYGYSRRS